MGQQLTKKLITILNCYKLETGVVLTKEQRAELDKIIATLEKELKKSSKNRVVKKQPVAKKKPTVKKVDTKKKVIDFVEGLLLHYLEHEAVKVFIDYLQHLT